MSKWTFRLIGLGVVVALSVALFKTWFLPKEIPPALQKEISIQVNNKPVPAVESQPPASVIPAPLETAQKKEKDTAGDKPPSPPLTLLSYDEVDQGEKTQTQTEEKQVERPPNIQPLQKTIVEHVKTPPEPQPQPEEEKKVEVVKKVDPVPVQPEPKPEPPPPPPAPKPEPKKTAIAVNRNTSVPRGGNWVQAGAFSSQENTRNFVARLKRKSWPVATEDAVVNGKLVHRVLIGPLSPADVEEYINILGKMGFNARQVSR